MSTRGCGSLDTYADDVARIRQTLPELAAEIVDFVGIGQVADWLACRERPVIDLVGMDEFEYDFSVELKAEGRWLVFGVT